MYLLQPGMDACRTLRYWRDRKKRWRWAAVVCAPRCRSWTLSPPRKHTTWSKSWTTGASAPSTTSPPPYRQPVRPYRRICIRPPPGRISTGEFIVLIIIYYNYKYCCLLLFFFFVAQHPHNKARRSIIIIHYYIIIYINFLVYIVYN